MGKVINAVEKFLMRRQSADKARGFSNQESETDKKIREMKAKLDRSRGIKS